jgi:hypothetical protein
MLYLPKHHLPSPPFVDVEGILNFRDVGGYPVLPQQNNDHHQRPRSIRRGLIFRSAEPTRITPSGMRKVQSLGINTIFDLRSASEAMKDVKSIEEEGSRIHRVSVPIFAQDEESPIGSPNHRSPVSSDEDGSDDGMLKGILRNSSRSPDGSRPRRAGSPLEHEKHAGFTEGNPGSRSPRRQYAADSMARAKNGIAQKPDSTDQSDELEETQALQLAIPSSRGHAPALSPQPSAAYKRCAAFMSSGAEVSK